MTPSGFEIVEHTADVAVKGWGSDLPELFSAMARGMFSIIADPSAVHHRTSRRITLEADSLSDLLHTWLDELNSLHQIEHELYCGFVLRVTGRKLEAFACGEPLDAGRHELRTEVKAVTWHDLRVEPRAEGYEAYVLLDI